MNTEEIARIVGDQRAYFKTHATFDVDARRRALVSLRDAVRAHEADIAHALKTDLGKSHDEAYMCEIGTSLSEIRHQIAHVARWSRPRLRPCDLANAVSVCKTQAVPYGVTLIMAPWNYPFLLTLEPLAGALAAGNTVVIKPSAYAPASSAVLKQICEEAFDPCLVTVVEGGRAENEALLDECWDKIFFTGSVSVGKLVMERASKNLTPVTLELGGKSPCIVDATANLKVAARRIAFGKWLNVGQTCVAPDYLLVDTRVHDELLGLITVDAYVLIVMFIVFKIIDKTIGLRVPAEVEIDGLDIHEHGLASAYAGFSISDANAAAMVPNENTDLGEDDASKASAVQMNAAVPVVKEPAVIHDGIYDTGMHKVSIIAKLSKFDPLKTALNDLGVTGMTVTQVMGCGIQKGTTEKYRGVPVDSTLLPKIKVEVIVSKISVDAVVDAAKKALYTGHIGDGKIFVYNVTRVVKIRTGEEDFAALQDVE